MASHRLSARQRRGAPASPSLGRPRLCSSPRLSSSRPCPTLSSHFSRWAHAPPRCSLRRARRQRPCVVRAHRPGSVARVSLGAAPSRHCIFRPEYVYPPRRRRFFVRAGGGALRPRPISSITDSLHMRLPLPDPIPAALPPRVLRSAACVLVSFFFTRTRALSDLYVTEKERVCHPGPFKAAHAYARRLPHTDDDDRLACSLPKAADRMKSTLSQNARFPRTPGALRLAPRAGS